MRISHATLAILAALSIAAPVAAKTHTVKMLNRGAAGMMVFDSAVIRVSPGDTVTFLPNDLGHNAESIPGMVPAGAAPFKGAMNKPLTVTFTQQGVYGYKCAPHVSMGMVGVIVVGRPANLAQAKAVNLPGKAKPVMASLLGGIR